MNGILCSVSYSKQLELNLDDLESVISMISFLCVILCISQLFSWLCCVEVTAFKTIAIGNVAVDVVVIVVFSYSSGAYISVREQDNAAIAVILCMRIYL